MQQIIDIGAVVNDPTADNARVAGQKINDNFTEIYGAKQENVDRDTDGTLSSNSDLKYPSVKAVVTYVASQVAAFIASLANKLDKNPLVAANLTPAAYKAKQQRGAE